MESEPTLESIASSRQLESKLLRMTVKDLKDNCMEGSVFSYAWLRNKEMKMPSSMEAVMEGKG